MYKGISYNIFICYRGSNESGLLASKIYSDLIHYTNVNGEREFAPFFAPVCIEKGANYKDAIKQVLEDVKCLIMVISNGFFDNCSNDDDIVYFELMSALSVPRIQFVPIIIDGYNMANDKTLINLFSTSDLDRIRHINAINYHGIYDFKTEIDLVPVLHNSLENRISDDKSKDCVHFDLDKFKKESGIVVPFGKYPQSVLSDLDLINKIATGVFTGETTLDKKTNWLKHNNYIYATFAENPFNKTKFDDGKAINTGARNYFKVEPLKWIVLYSYEDYYVLMSEKIIDAVQFNLNRHYHRQDSNKLAPPNCWELSYVRRWLNSEFLYDAFDEQEISMIVPTRLDNSQKSAYYKTEDGADTIDRIFLISHREIINLSCGSASTTDYSRARGAYSSTSSSHEGKGDWWTRSPGDKATSIENIDRRGCIKDIPQFCNYVDDTAAGIRPVIIIKKIK